MHGLISHAALFVALLSLDFFCNVCSILTMNYSYTISYVHRSVRAFKQTRVSEKYTEKIDQQAWPSL